MALKITKAFEPIETKTVIMCLYAQPGLGRTTAGYTAEAPLLLDFDQGAHRAKNRKDTVRIERWADVDSMEQADFAPYKTVIVDTVGRCLDAMTVPILAADPKNGNRSGGLSLQGYGVLKTTFATWLNKLRSYGLDVVLLAHMDEQKKGDEMMERLDIQGGSKNEVYKVSDAMGRIYMENRKRLLSFSPNDVAFGKNPAQLDVLEVPHFDKMDGFLGNVIAKTKAEINAMSAEQTEVAGLLAAWKAKLDASKTPADFDALILLGKELDERIRENAKRALVKAAKDREIVFDVKAGAFVGKKEEAKPENPKAASPSSGTSSDSQQPSGAATDAGSAASPDAQAITESTPIDGTTSATEPANDNKKKRGKKKEAEAQPELLPTADETRIPGQEG